MPVNSLLPSASETKNPRRQLRRWAAGLMGLGLLSCVSPEPAHAQPKIQVLMKNGTEWKQDLPNIRKIVFQSPNLVFSLTGGTTHQIVHADIRRITFDVPISTHGANPATGTGNTSLLKLDASAIPGGKVELSVSLPASTRLRLEVLSLDGARVKTVAEGEYPPGTHALAWEGRDDSGRQVQPGTFLVVASAAGKSLTRKIQWLGQVNP